MSRCLCPACAARRAPRLLARLRRWYVDGWIDALDGRL